MKCSDCPFYVAGRCTWKEVTTPAYGPDWPAPCEEDEPPEPEEGWMMERQLGNTFKALDAMRKTLEELRDVVAQQAEEAKSGTGTSEEVDALEDAAECGDRCLEALDESRERLEEVRDHLAFLREGGLL